MHKDNVIREYPSLSGGKYRVRLIQPVDHKGAPTGDPLLDIREYVKARQFDGFTRRGVRLNMSDVAALPQIIAEVVRDSCLAREKPEVARPQEDAKDSSSSGATG